MSKKFIQHDGTKDLAVLGPKSTYCDLAADKFISISGFKLKKKYFHSIGEIFNAVEKGHAGQGIVPLENIIYGSIRETYDRLFHSSVHITEKFTLGIEHVMVTLPGTNRNDIHTIASHEQALEQCRTYIEKNFPNARKQYSTSTMDALETMVNADDRGMAVIIPSQAAMGLPLKILAKNVQGFRKNLTSFIVIRKGPCPKNIVPRGRNIETSIAFYFRKDSPGSLYTVFREFAEAGINLSYIESRPSIETPGNYVFYLNFLSGGSLKPVQKTVAKIKPMLAGLKILGIYGKI